MLPAQGARSLAEEQSPHRAVWGDTAGGTLGCRGTAKGGVTADHLETGWGGSLETKPAGGGPGEKAGGGRGESVIISVHNADPLNLKGRIRAKSKGVTLSPCNGDRDYAGVPKVL